MMECDVNRKFQQGRVGLIAILFLGAAVIVGLWYFKPEPAKRPPAKAQIAIVDTIVAKPKGYQATLSSQGIVEPKRQINLVAEVSGRVIGISDDFVSGGFFKSGDTLVKLDDRDYRYALANAQAQVASAERELALEKGQARQAKRVWRDLGSNEANSLSLREPQVKAARLALNAAKAEQQRALLNIERASISAPFDGRVDSAQVNIGQFVPTGSSIGSVFDSGVVEVRLPLNSEQFDLLGIRPNADDRSVLSAVPVKLSSFIGDTLYEWPATLSRIEASLDSRTRLFHIVVEVEQPFDPDAHGYPLLVGLFVEAILQGKTLENVISMPKKALLDDQVFVLGDENKLELRAVTLVDSDDDTVWIKSNIAQGQQIVVSDPRVLREGSRVETNQPLATDSSPGEIFSSQTQPAQIPSNPAAQQAASKSKE